MSALPTPASAQPIPASAQPIPASALPTPGPGPIRYGLIGSGYFGMTLGRAFSALPDAVISHVFDPENADAAVREFGARATATLEELCASDVTAIIVASPNHLHAEAVLAAAAAGTHIFCEKPIALNYADCAAMVDRARAAGVLFMAGHVMNFMTGVRYAKRLIADGVIGDVFFTRAVRTGWEASQPLVSWKKRREYSGGHLYHHIHELDVVQFLMGPAETVTMIGGNVAHHGPEHGDEEDMLIGMLEFGNNTFATIEYGSAFRHPEHHLQIQGSLGTIRIDLQDAGVTVVAGGITEHTLLHRSEAEDRQRNEIYRGEGTDGAVMYGAPSEAPPLWLQGITDEEAAYFHGLLRGATPEPEFVALTDGSAARDAIATADALTLSLREGRKVRVAEIIG